MAIFNYDKIKIGEETTYGSEPISKIEFPIKEINHFDLWEISLVDSPPISKDTHTLALGGYIGLSKINQFEIGLQKLNDKELKLKALEFNEAWQQELIRDEWKRRQEDERI